MFGFWHRQAAVHHQGAHSSAALSVIPNADGGVYRSAGLSQYSGSVVNHDILLCQGARVMGEAGPSSRHFVVVLTVAGQIVAASFGRDGDVCA